MFSNATPGSRWLAKLWPPTIAAALIIYGALGYHLALGWPGVPYASAIQLMPVGWRNFAQQAEQLEDVLEKQTGGEPLIVGLDRNAIISQVAFYLPDRREAVVDSIGQHVFGEPALMYEWWSKKKQFDGRPMLLLGLDADELERRTIARHFAWMSEPQRGEIIHNGRVVREFYHRYGYGYSSRRIEPPEGNAKSDVGAPGER